MSLKLTMIFLSFFLVAIPAKAKPAPNNTFKIVDNPMPFSNQEKVRAQIKEIQDKIGGIQAQAHTNFFVEKFNNFRLTRLEKDLESKSKKQF